MSIAAGTSPDLRQFCGLDLPNDVDGEGYASCCVAAGLDQADLLAAFFENSAERA
jgi:hypothetical protein